MHIKELKKVWRKYPQFSKSSTIIVDDRPENCVRNFGNAVYIPAFDLKAYGFSPIQNDDYLLRLCFFISCALPPGTNVRYVEKRGWQNHPCATAFKAEAYADIRRAYCSSLVCAEHALTAR